MIENIYTKLKQNAPLAALLQDGQNFKIFPYDEVPQNTKPEYVAYGVYDGRPENTMDQAPQVDNMGTQFDIWATTRKKAQEVFNALRVVLEEEGHMITFRQVQRDPETKLYHARQEYDFFVDV